jgi:hypothetical protein
VLTKIVLAVKVLVVTELAKNADVERIAGMEERNPIVPRPVTVDASCDVR